MASSTPDNLFKAILGAFTLVGVAVTIGAAHSLYAPVQLRLDTTKLTSTQPLPEGAEPPADGSSTEPTASPAEQDPPADPTPPAETTTQGPAAADGIFLTLDQAHERFYIGAMFLDARPRHEYDAAHIEGALYLSTETIANGSAGPVLDELIAMGYDYPLVLYCHGGDCDASENTAIRLQQMGFTNIRIMKAGFDEWQAAGFEVETP